MKRNQQWHFVNESLRQAIATLNYRAKALKTDSAADRLNRNADALRGELYARTGELTPRPPVLTDCKQCDGTGREWYPGCGDGDSPCYDCDGIGQVEVQS